MADIDEKHIKIGELNGKPIYKPSKKLHLDKHKNLKGGKLEID